MELRDDAGEHDGGFLKGKRGAEADAWTGAEWQIGVPLHPLASGTHKATRIKFVRTLP